jgi:capsular polysaccharide transport system permease protein
MRYEFLYRNRWFMLVVVLPTILAVIYFGLIASDQYVSESRFLVKNQSEKQTSTPSLASLIQTTGLSSGQEQTNEVLDYLRSRNALSDLVNRYDVKTAYSSPSADIFSRYPRIGGEDRFEDLYRFYGDKTNARLDTQSGLAILTATAFNAKDAQDINRTLLTLSEQLVNRLNVTARQNAVAESQRRVAAAEDRVRRARVALARYRNSEEILDPSKQAAGPLDISNKLVAQQAALQAQLDITRRIAPQNPAIPALQEQIVAIGKQIDAQNGRVVGTKSGIASKITGYESLQTEQEFATQSLTAANISLDQAETESVRQQYYLERVVQPNEPDVALLPHRIVQILTVFGAAICFYLIGWMLAVGILEHAPED